MGRTIFDEVLKPLGDDEEVIPQTSILDTLKTEEAIPVATKKPRTIFDPVAEVVESDKDRKSVV